MRWMLLSRGEKETERESFIPKGFQVPESTHKSTKTPSDDNSRADSTIWRCRIHVDGSQA